MVGVGLCETRGAWECSRFSSLLLRCLDPRAWPFIRSNFVHHVTFVLRPWFHRLGRSRCVVRLRVYLYISCSYLFICTSPYTLVTVKRTGCCRRSRTLRRPFSISTLQECGVAISLPFIFWLMVPPMAGPFGKLERLALVYIAALVNTSSSTSSYALVTVKCTVLGWQSPSCSIVRFRGMASRL